MKRFLGAQILRAAGWTVEGETPRADHYVLIAAPHTSNWDFPLMMALSLALGVRIAWMGKHTLFEPPLGFVMHSLGGIPIERHRRNNLVEQMAERLRAPEPLALVVPAEGTRGRAERWKSGFYHIARAAGVPVVLAYLDYPRKIGGIGPTITLTGDVRKDMDAVRAFYADKVGLHPESSGPIRLREEDDVGTTGGIGGSTAGIC
jgi:1-acyl-sn-glycerol-3-phosphate acyltransferase